MNLDDLTPEERNEVQAWYVRTWLARRRRAQYRRRVSAERRREIAAEAGRCAHLAGTAHQWTVEEARIAGRKSADARRRARERQALEPCKV
jgi:hypothetical protein